MTSVAIGPADQLDPRLLEHRRELTGYCYRMLGSSFDAEDAVQETMVRAWRGLGGLRGPVGAAVVALPDRHQRLPRPAVRPAAPRAADGPVRLAVAAGRASLAARRPGTAWVEPVLDRQVLPEDGDPAERAVQRESIRLAFVAALQHLPPRQRAVLILREVLRWKADEVAPLLDTTVASVNSALQRARATLAAVGGALDPRRWTTTTASCWRATSTPSSATTSTRSCGCCTTTPPSTCPRTRCGCAGATTSARGCSARAGAAGTRGWCR